MKKEYNTAKLDIISVSDVIATSDPGQIGDNPLGH